MCNLIIFIVSLANYSYLTEIKLRYSNRAVNYSNTTVKKADIEQPTVEHNLDFKSIIVSIIGWILSTSKMHNRLFSKHNWFQP